MEICNYCILVLIIHIFTINIVEIVCCAMWNVGSSVSEIFLFALIAVIQF